MADFDLSMAVELEAAGVVTEADKLVGSIDRIDEAARKGAAGTRQLETATEGVSKSVVSLVGIEQRLDQVIAAVQQSTIGAARGHSALRDAIAAQATATAGLTINTNAASSAQGAAALSANDQAAAEQRLAKATSDAERSAAAAALAMLKLQQAQEGNGGAAAKLERDMAALRAAIDPVGEAERRMAQQIDLANTALARGVITADQHAAHLRSLTTDLDKSGAASNRNAFALRNAGQQVGDFATQVTLGGGVARAFASQAGQMGFALSEFEKGPLARVGKFMVGPWGIAFTVAAVALSPFIEKLFDSNKALDEQRDRLEKAATAADSYGNAQSLLGKIIDLNTGKFKTQNQVLIQTIRLQAQSNILKAQADQKTATAALSAKGAPTLIERLGTVAAGSATQGQGIAAEGAKLAARLAPIKDVVQDYVRLTSIAGASQESLDKGLAATIRRLDQLGRTGKLAGRDLIDAKQSVLALATTLNDQRANKLVIDGADGKGVDDLLKPYERAKKPPKAKAPKSTAALDEFGRDAADRIDAINESFNETPSQVLKVNRAVATLDDLIEDLSRKKPPNFQELIAQAQAAKIVVREAINRPFDDFIESQSRAFDNQRLINAGRVDEAAAAQQVYAIEKAQGPLSQQRKDAILATVQAIRQEQRETEILREQQQAYLTTLGQIKAAVRGVIFDGVNGIKDLPKKLIDSFAQLQGEKLFDKLFAGTFRDLEDQVKGTKTVQDASDKMAEAVNLVAKKSDALGVAFDNLAGKVPGTTGTGAAVAGASGAAALLDASGNVDTKALGALLNSTGSAPDPLAPTGGPAEVVVAGNRLKDPQSFFANAATKLAKGVGISDAAAKTIGEYGGKAIKGAATGALTNSVFAPIAKGLGLKTSKTGAQVGGAIGSFVPIPGGDIIGSVIGSVVGGLFKKSKQASSTLSFTDGEAIGGTGTGTGKEARNTATGLGSSLASGLNQIADALGGQLGTANVSIGYRPGHKAGAFRVDPTGGGAVKDGSVKAFETEAEAIAFALRDAILDGAVTGLSSAMQKALQSNPDIDKAVSEALKVKDVEAFIANAADALKSQFAEFDKTAASRVAIARKYGVDVLAVEKANGEARTKLIDSALKSAVGGLQSFLTDLSTGDLFEGNAAEKRTALLSQIETAKGDVAKGADGAGDTLAGLYRQLLATSREGFGTAGPEYTTDRTTSANGAAAVIAAERARIEKASGTALQTTEAVTKNNTLTSETNDLLAVTNAKLESLPASLASLLTTSNTAGFSTFRVTSLA